MIIAPPLVMKFIFCDDGVFPNNPLLPLLIYQQVFKSDEKAQKIETCLKRNNWKHAWRNGIYTYHHYHSTAHEVLVALQGQCKLRVGGPAGELVEIRKGDVILIPAGVAHCNMGCSEDFTCLGAYPDGQEFDVNFGKREERPAADENIQKLAIPSQDPIYGNEGPLKRFWKVVENDGL